jgi:cation:H+ antiporter
LASAEPMSPAAPVIRAASLAGTPALSVGDLLGSAAVNVVILAIADAVYGRRALTSTPASPGVLLQRVLGVILFALVLAPVVAGDRLVFGVGAWSWIMLAASLVSVRIIARSQGLRSWVPAQHGAHEARATAPAALARRSLNRLIGSTAVAGCAIWSAAWNRSDGALPCRHRRTAQSHVFQNGRRLDRSPRLLRRRPRGALSD